jgi:hypothetical protein
MKTTILLSRLARRCAAFFAGVSFCIALQSECRAVSIYNIGLNTTALAGQSGFAAFDLIGGDSLAANNTITITNLATDGLFGNAAGFSLTDTGFFNEVLRGLTFGTYLSFTLQLTENNAAPGTDQFSFFLLDASFLPILGTTDPTGASALFAVDITGAVGGSSAVFDTILPNTGVDVAPQTPNNVPDGENALLSLAMVLFALALAGGRGRLARTA